MKAALFEPSAPFGFAVPGSSIRHMLVLAFLSIIAVPGQSQTPPSQMTGLDSYIEQARQDWGAVGVAVAVVQGDKLVFAEGFGRRQAGHPEMVDADTLFQIGSTTKAFTATAMGMLVDEGKLKWDDPVIDHVPSFRLRDPWLTRHITVRDLLAHRTGISDPGFFVLRPMTLEQAVGQLRFADDSAKFRDSYRYSNLMYAVAQQVIEHVSGQSWQDFVEKRLLRPLRMNRSQPSPYRIWDRDYVTPTFFGSAPAGDVDLGQARDPNVAMPHGRTAAGATKPLPWQSYDNAAAAGSIVSNVRDMANWLMLHLNGGAFEGSQLISGSTVQELHSPQNLRAGGDKYPFEKTGETYAFGWRRSLFNGRVHLSHGGGIIGFPAYVAFLPAERIGVVVLANGPKTPGDEYSLHKAITFEIFQRLLGGNQDWKRAFLAKHQAASDAMARSEDKLRTQHRIQHVPVGRLRELEGCYVSEMADPVLVSGKDGRLSLRFPGRGAFAADLEPWGPDLFRLLPEPTLGALLGAQFVTFATGRPDRADSFSLFDATFSRTEETSRCAGAEHSPLASPPPNSSPR